MPQLILFHRTRYHRCSKK